jgi:glyoxylase-like metal-dependent hydrolase (beta-lactamase superfamily II)
MLARLARPAARNGTREDIHGASSDTLPMNGDEPATPNVTMAPGMPEPIRDSAGQSAVSSPRYPCGEAPAPGEAKEIAPGVLWLRMPLPFDLSHINVWAIRDGDGWAIFDTGMHTPQALDAWRRICSDSGPLGGRKPTRVLATHMHPDHVGMAGWLTREFDCALWMTRAEYLTCRVLAADTGREAPLEGLRFYRRAGWDADGIESYRSRFGRFGSMIAPLPESYRRVRDGDCIRIGEHDWHVVVGAGHSPEHACFFCPDLQLLISGDQVLPRISSNVSVFPTEPDENPLHDWLSSLDKLTQAIPDDVLVLPAHDDPFYGLHTRLARLASGHARQLDRLRRVLATGPRRAVDIFTTLFGLPISANTHVQQLATGESLAHLNYLMRRGEAIVSDDADGVAWYRAHAASPAPAA